LFGRTGLLGLVTGLPGIIVFIVVAFLIEPATTYRPLALPCMRLHPVHSVVASRAVCGILHLPRIRDFSLSFQNANLLLVRFLALHNRSPAMCSSSSPLWPCASAALALVDAAHRIRIIFQITLYRVDSLHIF
jgi:hypothetical protein